MQINAGWQFREVGKTDWHDATVPGCVHTDLLANKLIDDPFYRDNEKKQQWIGKKDWEYRTTFKVTPQTLARENVELVFEGLDTYAQVYLNEQLVLNADNMFRTWRVDAKPALKAGDNTLRIVFRSPDQRDSAGYGEVELPTPRAERSRRKDFALSRAKLRTITAGIGDRVS